MQLTSHMGRYCSLLTVALWSCLLAGQESKPNPQPIPGMGSSGSSVIGCLSGPDADGRITLRSMQYRTGLEVSGPKDLADAAGKKVKLTGKWDSADAGQPASKSVKRFEATEFEVLANTCSPPAETQPASNEKQKKKKK